VTAKRSALIVATSEYQDARLAPLEGPGRDADALGTVLANVEIGEFDVQLALNSSVDALRRTLESFFANRSRDDLLLVHFSGHGLKDDDGQLYLAAADTEIDRLLSTGVDAAWVNRLMNKCRSEKIALFLDCCFAGAFTTGMARRVGVDTAGVKEQFTGSGLFVIAASDAMQYSFEGGKQVGLPPEPSPFTKALVDGLQSGEADRNEDGVVSINELFDYLEDRIRETSPSQTPTKSAFNQVGDWAIARSTRVPSIRLLPEALQELLKSENPLDRIGSLIDLRDLVRGPDSRLADAAMQALQRLAKDDSRSVAARAQRVIDEEAIRTGTEIRVEPGPAPAASPLEAPPEPALAVAGTPAAAIVPPPEPVVVAPSPPVVVPPAPVVVALEPPVVVPPAAAAAFVAPGAPAAPPPQASAGPSTGPGLWGQPQNPPGQPRAASTSAQGQREQSSGVPWNLGRAAARAFIGSFLWMMLQYLWVISTVPGILNDPDKLDFATTVFTELAVLIAIVTTVAVVIVEKLVPALRVPSGSAYGIVGGNRWAAAGILGALSGLTIGLTVEAAYFATAEALGLDTIVCAALGFIVAEAIVGRWFAGNRQERSQPA
jgi:caspase domain-containing protein